MTDALTIEETTERTLEDATMPVSVGRSLCATIVAERGRVQEMRDVVTRKVSLGNLAIKTNTSLLHIC